MPAGIAAAIHAPAFHAVDATPRAIVHNFREMIGGMTFEEFTVICKLRELVGLNVVQRVGKCHLSETVVMTVTFAVRRDVDQLRPLPGVGKTAVQPVGKALTIVQQSIE